jgi:hypothetical protein
MYLLVVGLQLPVLAALVVALAGIATKASKPAAHSARLVEFVINAPF